MVRWCKRCCRDLPHDAFDRGRKDCRFCVEHRRDRSIRYPFEAYHYDSAVWSQLKAERKRLEAETGEAHEIDHIIPLTPKFEKSEDGYPFSGLDVPWNWSVESKAVNRQKWHKV